MAAIAQSPGPSIGVYRALERRNRVIGVLRLVVPLLGLLVLGALGIQMIIGTVLTRDFAIGRVTIERNRLQVEMPRYAGLLADGTGYEVSAASASGALDQPSVIELIDAHIVLTKVSGVIVTIDAARAELETQLQLIDVPGVTLVTDTEGMRAEVDLLHVDMVAQVATGGRTRVDYASGQSLDAEAIRYDALTREWTFTGAAVGLPDLPEIGEETP